MMNLSYLQIKKHGIQSAYPKIYFFVSGISIAASILVQIEEGTVKTTSKWQ